MSATDWLDSLKPGDRVFVAFSLSKGGALHQVARRTPTQIVLANGDRFNARTGRLVGGDEWSRASIEEATPERMEEVERRVLSARIRAAHFETMPMDALREIAATVKKHRAVRAETPR